MRDSDCTPANRTTATPTRGQELRLLWAGVLLIAVCYGLGRYAYGFFVPVFRIEFGLESTVVGVIAAGSYVSYCVAIILSTVLIPRLGARPVAVGAGCLATGGLLIVTFAPNTVALAIGVLIAGSSTGMSSPPLAEAVARTVRAKSRDRTQTVINAAAGAGVAIAGPVALLTQEQWQAAWFTFAMTCAIVTVYVAFTVPSAPRPEGGRTARPAILPQPLFPTGSAHLMTAAALMGAASSAVWTFGRDVFVNVGGMDETTSTIAWMLLGAAGVLGAAAGDLARRFSIGKAWVTAMVAMGAATVSLAVFPDITIVAWIATSTFGAVYITLTGLLLIWGTQVYPLTPAAGVGLAFLVISLGQAMAAPMIGRIIEGISAQVAFTAVALVAVIGAFIQPVHREQVSPSAVRQQAKIGQLNHRGVAEFAQRRSGAPCWRTFESRPAR